MNPRAVGRAIVTPVEWQSDASLFPELQQSKDQAQCSVVEIAPCTWSLCVHRFLEITSPHCTEDGSRHLPTGENFLFISLDKSPERSVINLSTIPSAVQPSTWIISSSLIQVLFKCQIYYYYYSPNNITNKNNYHIDAS